MPAETHDLDAAIDEMRAATIALINGQPEAWLARCSQRPDATLFGGWGGHERGWGELAPRYAWASARYTSGDMAFEELSRVVSGNLACTVHHERMQARLSGSELPVPIALRVTHIYRHEDDGWKLLHRHADALLDILPPEAAIAR
ncbi:MAG: nuclear transport factor 2 family protein [Thermomicrobiales bacterium]|nr:nuclear transport factor 2 family protein [Thermomicrobiales bacterium]